MYVLTLESCAMLGKFLFLLICYLIDCQED